MTELEYEKLASVNISPSDNPASLPASMFSVSFVSMSSNILLEISVPMYLLRHRCEYTTGILEQGCGREADKARGVAECLIRLRDHIRVQEFP